VSEKPSVRRLSDVLNLADPFIIRPLTAYDDPEPKELVIGA
jgi:hypothetical protein